MQQAPLLQLEAGALIDGLVAHNPLDIASPRWLRQHEALQRLNTQAHVNVMSGQDRDEYILEAFLSRGKLNVLVRELACIELWIKNIFKSTKIRELLKKQPLLLHAVVYHESLITNMLELFFFNEEAVREIGEDEMMILVDYCYRKLTYLNGLPAETIENLADPEGSRHDFIESCSFNSATFALSITRFIIENINKGIPLNVLHRIVVVQDFLEVLGPLILRSPWTAVVDIKTKSKDKGELQTKATRQTMKFHGGQWHAVERKEMGQVTQVEGQLWLALYMYVGEPEVLKKIDLTDHKRELITKLRAKVTTTVVDQLSILAELQRMLDTLAVAKSPSSGTGPSGDGYGAPSAPRSAFIIEEIPEVFETMRAIDWKTVQRNAKERLSGTGTGTAGAEAEAEVTRDEIKRMAESMADAALKAHVCDACHAPAEHRCSKCKKVWYCSRECQVSAWKKHKKECGMSNLYMK